MSLIKLAACPSVFQCILLL